MSWLFDPVGLIPRGFCLGWEPGFVWADAILDMGIGVAYCTIPLALVILARRRPPVVRPVFLLFATFIVLGGAIHLLDVLTLWVPAYGPEAVVKAATGVVSIITAIALWRVLPQALALPTVSQLQAAHVALQESEARYRATFEQSPVPMHIIDGDGVITDISETWTALLGYNREEVVGRHISDFWEPASGDWHEALQAHMIRPGKIVNRERRYLCRDGNVVDLLVSSRLERHRKPTSFVGSLTDITARKRAEEALRASEELLHQAQKMEAVGQLTGGIAHDFNNILQSIVGGLDLIERSIARGNPEGATRYIGIARKSADRAAGLTHRMLAFARRQALLPRVVEPDKLVHGMGELIRHTMGPEVEVQMRLRDGTWSVLCDPNQLESALLNLAINARDAMPAGGTFIITTVDRFLTKDDLFDQDESSPGEYVEIAVSDTGLGMTADVLARVFEPFFTTKPTGQGTGLGLSQVFGFVRQSGGFVRLESKPGLGTTVRLYMPRRRPMERDGSQQQSCSNVPVSADIATADAAGKTVLVVEDEADVRDMIADLLRDLGCRVIEAEDGNSGLRLVQSRPQIDMLVTDVGLPGLNGRQLADAARESRPRLPVLLITGYAGKVLDDTEFAPGMEVLRKPFASDAFAARVSALLNPQVLTLANGPRSPAQHRARASKN